VGSEGDHRVKKIWKEKEVVILGLIERILCSTWFLGTHGKYTCIRTDKRIQKATKG
jgi:hypothetical protein